VPEVDATDGPPLAVALQQQRGASNARSSVGSVTTLSSLVRMMYSRAGAYPANQFHQHGHFTRKRLSLESGYRDPLQIKLGPERIVLAGDRHGAGQAGIQVVLEQRWPPSTQIEQPILFDRRGQRHVRQVAV
jgi:excinuclease UvrABC ATPase subunit